MTGSDPGPVEKSEVGLPAIDPKRRLLYAVPWFADLGGYIALMTNESARIRGPRQRAPKTSERCRGCPHRSACLPAALDSGELHRFERIVKHRVLRREGQYLYRSGEAFEALYILRSGALKTQYVSEDGGHRLADLHLPPDVMGLDALELGYYPTDAVASERSDICVVPYADLETLSADFPSLRHRLAAAMSQSMAHDDAMHRMLSTWRADQRLASFLWQLANRRRRLDLGAVTFRLPLQRQELATHLGVSKETISRTMRHLEQSGCLRLRNRTVTILDLNTLQQIAGALEVEPHSGRTSPKRA